MQKGLQRTTNMDATPVFKVDYKHFNIHPSTHNAWHSKHWTSRFLHTQDCIQQTLCSECTYLKAASTFCNYSRIRFARRTWEVTGHLSVTDNGLTKGTTGHVWNGFGFEDFWLDLFCLFEFRKIQRYAQAHKCDWTSCDTLRMQRVCLIILDDEPMWTKLHLAFKKKVFY